MVHSARLTESCKSCGSDRSRFNRATPAQGTAGFDYELAVTGNSLLDERTGTPQPPSFGDHLAPATPAEDMATQSRRHGTLDT